MGRNTPLVWTDHTFNPWVGCGKVSPGCDHCYAEVWGKRSGLVGWGAAAPRRRTSEANWRTPLAWDREAAARGARRRVFCASLADVFDNAIEPLWRADLWALIRATPNLVWMLLTKRPQNAPSMLPADWGPGYANVWLGVTAENQEEANRRLPLLAALPARLRFLSCEPLLGPVELGAAGWDRCPSCRGAGAKEEGENDACWLCPACLGSGHSARPAIGWILAGGETGGGARPMDPAWARSLCRQCEEAKIPFLFKQNGEFLSGPRGFVRVGRRRSGRLLDGREWLQFPEV